MNLSQKLELIQNRIESAKKRGGYGRPVQLIAVTKTRPFSVIEECYKSGITEIGENRVQEAEQKFESFEEFPNLTKRFIGHLQSNKVNKCLDLFDTIDSVDSIKLAKKISGKAAQRGKIIPVLLEVNTSGESQKNGFSPDNIDDMLSSIVLENINVIGLMTVGPLSREEKETRKAFTSLRKLQTRLNNEIGSERIEELSMGMSGDFEIGIEEGSTMVRIGTALLGSREK